MARLSFSDENSDENANGASQRVRRIPKLFGCRKHFLTKKIQLNGFKVLKKIIKPIKKGLLIILDFYSAKTLKFRTEYLDF